MNGWATTRGALIRGGSVDAYGDETDDDSTPVDGWGDFALSIIEKSRNVQDPTTGTWSAQSYLTARVPYTLPVIDGDRIRDGRDGTVYQITDIGRIPRGLAGWSSRTLDMKQTDA